MQIPRNNTVHAAKLCLIFFLLTIGVSGQKTAPDRLTLGRFDKSIEEGKLVEVEGNLLDYLIKNPKDPEGFALMAKLRLRQNRPSEARSLSLRALALSPELMGAKLSLAAAHFQLGDASQARSVLETIADTATIDDVSRLRLVQTYSLIGDCTGALNTADRLAPQVKNGDALALRAACYLETGSAKDLNALIPFVKAVAKREPTIAVDFARILVKASKQQEATDLLKLVIVASPQNSNALLLLARSEISQKDYLNARLHLERAEKIEPTSAELFYVKAMLENGLGNSTPAIDLLERSLAIDPNNTEVLAQFVVIAMRANQSGKAARAAEKLSSQRPTDADFLYLFGAALLQNNNLPRAETVLRQFLTARPDDSRGCLALGLTFAAQSDKLTEARTQLEKCLAANPNNVEAAYQLGLSYKTQGDLAKAIEYLELTVSLSSDNAFALRDLGAVFIQSGNEMKARPVLEKAVLLNPRDADTHFQLSKLYNLISEPDLAKKHLKIFQDLSKAKNGLM